MRKNLKLIIISVLTGMIISTVGIVTAQTIINSSEVTYDNSKSKGSFENVQNSLDELYAKAGYTGEEYHEDILNEAYPVLSGELIPIDIKDNGDVYYANTHTKWYEYATKRWANAVILVDDAYAKNREDEKDKYSVGDKISEEDIESYFVWIPRYAYKLWDLGEYTSAIDAKTLVDSDSDYATSSGNIIGKARIIDVEFGTLDYLQRQGYQKQSRDATTGLISDPIGIEIGDYLIHPGFSLSYTELNGFWMGKFEVGFNQTNYGETAIKNTSNWKGDSAIQNNTKTNKVVIKPNVFSWRYISIANAFSVSLNYNKNLKSHMLKNTEWGAIAYLSHSVYDKGSEVNINNTSDMKTGYSASPNSNQSTYPGDNGLSTSGLSEPYNTSSGYLASTTGNITGVYDMSGGGFDMVSAVLKDQAYPEKSEFSQEDVNKYILQGYIDVYPSDSTSSPYDKRILGDATGELGPFYQYHEKEFIFYHNSWYSDDCLFFHTNAATWLSMGDAYYDGVLTSQFTFYYIEGVASSNSTFRLALAPSN